jgi:hypothetical protein
VNCGLRIEKGDWLGLFGNARLRAGVKMGEGIFAFCEKCRIWSHLVASQFSARRGVGRGLLLRASRLRGRDRLSLRMSCLHLEVGRCANGTLRAQQRGGKWRF